LGGELYGRELLRERAQIVSVPADGVCHMRPETELQFPVFISVLAPQCGLYGHAYGVRDAELGSHAS